MKQAKQEPVPHDAKPKEDLRYGKQAPKIPSSHYLPISSFYRNYSLGTLGTKLKCNFQESNGKRGGDSDDSQTKIDLFIYTQYFEPLGCDSSSVSLPRIAFEETFCFRFAAYSIPHT